jgi:hypothetical protein
VHQQSLQAELDAVRSALDRLRREQQIEEQQTANRTMVSSVTDEKSENGAEEADPNGESAHQHVQTQLMLQQQQLSETEAELAELLQQQRETHQLRLQLEDEQV